MGLSEHYTEINGNQQDNDVVFHDAQISHGYLFLHGKSELSGSTIIMISQAPASVHDNSSLRDLVSDPASLDELIASTHASIVLVAPSDGEKIINAVQEQLADGWQIDYAARYAAVQNYLPVASEQDVHDYAINIEKTADFLTAKDKGNSVNRYNRQDEGNDFTPVDPTYKILLP